MLNTSSWVCREMARLLVEFNVKTVICSPGTRNAPLLMAFNRNRMLKCHTVIDERSAAFMATGLSQARNEPVAICCTSGSALLNYAPAVSEAFYKGLPLIVISADRPLEWIGQADSQTIRQAGTLDNIVAASYSVSDGCNDDETNRWFVNRTLNEALLMATCPGKNRPVHINIHLSEPLDREVEDSEDEPVRVIKNMLPPPTVPTDVIRKFALESLKGKKILCVFGNMLPDYQLSKAICKLADNSCVTVIAEDNANLFGNAHLRTPDNLLATISAYEERYYPDVIFYAGGAIVSRSLKEFLRRSGAVCYRVGTDDNIIDTFLNQAGFFNVPPANFFRALSSALMPYRNGSDYKDRWLEASRASADKSMLELDKMEWCDFSAVAALLKHMPSKFNIQVSNGMAVRYAMNVPDVQFHRFDTNRGVSGIDGCTSTAIGATVDTDRTTILISGDMSAQYDVAALSSGLLSPRFKMVVLGNGNGGIFHIIKATRNLQEVDTLISPEVIFPARQLAEAYGFEFYEARSFEELEESISGFINEKSKPAMLLIDTSTSDSASIYRKYINNLMK